MAHLGHRLWDSALVLDLGPLPSAPPALLDSASVIYLGHLPSASPASSCHLSHSDCTLAVRAKTKAVCQNIEF